MTKEDRIMQKAIDEAVTQFRKEVGSFVCLLNAVQDGAGDMVNVERTVASFKSKLTINLS